MCSLKPLILGSLWALPKHHTGCTLSSDACDIAQATMKPGLFQQADTPEAKRFRGVLLARLPRFERGAFRLGVVNGCYWLLLDDCDKSFVSTITAFSSVE
jgi:hypothetical protein